VADETTITPSADQPLPVTGGNGEATESQEAPPPTSESTVDEVDREWRNRMSKRDKAHAEETQALRRQIEEANAREERRRRAEEEQRLQSMTEAERVAAERDALQRQLAEEKTLRIVETRSARYPAAAAELGDEVLAAMDEGKLAALNTKLAGQTATSPPSMIDPNSAARTTVPSGAGSPDKSVADLQRDLEKYAGEWKRG